jgi:hypothetical protein
MANKVEDDLRDDDGNCCGESDTQNSDPHASCGIIKAMKFAQHWHSRFCRGSAGQGQGPSSQTPR